VGPQLPARLARATVAVEDARFYRHGAVDPLALARAAVQGIVPGGGDPGGSTITQQLAKVLYLNGADDLLAQAQAVTLAFKLESDYSKRQILEMYLDDVYYGHGYWGAWAASEGYFGVRPDRLSWGQASMLAALPRAPSADDPVRHYARARAAQEHVLDRLQATGALSAAAATRAFAATSLRMPGPADETVAGRPGAGARLAPIG
jgi:penicillin-binding protein 1A